MEAKPQPSMSTHPAVSGTALSTLGAPQQFPPPANQELSTCFVGTDNRMLYLDH